jgi:hypothetical protein
MNSTVIGGAMPQHAPQFFTKPDTEDAGAIERVHAVAPDIVSMEPNRHHNYASLGWVGAEIMSAKSHYPRIGSGPVELTITLHALAHGRESRAAFIADPVGCADRYRLTETQREALIAFDTAALQNMGTHPPVPLLANMQLQRQRGQG